MTTLEPLWEPAPAGLTLATDEVHVWSAAIDLPEGRLPQLSPYLSPDEHARAARFRLGGDSVAADRWTLAAFVPAQEHVAAVAAEGPVRRFTCLRWDASDPG